MSASILIVDDEKSQRDILKTILTKEGYQVTDVGSVADALILLQEKEFQVILTDLKLQNESGLTLIEEVIKENQDQCIIMMTAHGTVDSAVDAVVEAASVDAAAVDAAVEAASVDAAAVDAGAVDAGAATLDAAGAAVEAGAAALPQPDIIPTVNIIDIATAKTRFFITIISSSFLY